MSPGPTPAPSPRTPPTTTPPAVPAPRLAFRTHQKLRVAAEFERTRRGARLGDGLFGLQYVGNELGHARLGMAVGLKAVGTAVRRNRVRRLIRESFRLHQHELPAVDLFVTARAGARGAEAAAIRASLARLWAQLRARALPA